MSHYCIAKSCSSKGSKTKKTYEQLMWEKHNGRITFHKIPKEPRKRKQWLDKLGLNESNVSKHSTVCSLHFSDKDIDRRLDTGVRLRYDAVPSNYITVSNELKWELFNEGQVYQQDHSIKSSVILPTTVMIHLPKKSPTHQVPCNKSPTSPVQNCVTERMTIPPHLPEHAPGKTLPESTIQHVKLSWQNKVKALQERQQRNMERYRKFQDIIADLRKQILLDARQLNMLHGMDGFHKLLRHQMNSGKKLYVPQQYSLEIEGSP